MLSLLLLHSTTQECSSIIGKVIKLPKQYKKNKNNEHVDETPGGNAPTINMEPALFIFFKDFFSFSEAPNKKQNNTISLIDQEKDKSRKVE